MLYKYEETKELMDAFADYQEIESVLLKGMRDIQDLETDLELKINDLIIQEAIKKYKKLHPDYNKLPEEVKDHPHLVKLRRNICGLISRVHDSPKPVLEKARGVAPEKKEIAKTLNSIVNRFLF